MKNKFKANHTTNHKSNKRRNIKRWMEARLRRLDWEINQNRATDRQRDRAGQLARALQIIICKELPVK